MARSQAARTPASRSAGKYSFGRPITTPFRSARAAGIAIGGSARVVASRGSCPDIAERTRVASLTVLPKTEMQSSDEPKATSPKRETRP